MELNVIQQNVYGRNLKNNSTKLQEFEEIVNKLYKMNPDILILSEFNYKKMFNIVKNRFEGYSFVTPKYFSEKDKLNERLYAACFIAYKQDKISIDRITEYAFIKIHMCKFDYKSNK